MSPAVSCTVPHRCLPPYGRKLRARLANRAHWARWYGTSPDGKAVSVHVVAGAAAWDWARGESDRRLLVVAPHSEDPARFDWSALAGHDPVLLVHAGALADEDAQRLVTALMHDGTRRVLAIGGLRP